MAKAKVGRKQLFRAALAIAGRTAGQWAEAEGYSPEHVSRVLNGRLVTSTKLAAKIDAFIKEHVGNRTTALAS